MPLYKELPRKKKEKVIPPLYRPIDALIAKIWSRRRVLFPFAVALAAVLLLYTTLRITTAHYEEKAKATGLTQLKSAKKALEGGRLDEALSYYEPMIESRYLHPLLRIAALENAALVYAKKGDFEKALKTLERSASDSRNKASDYSRLLVARTHEMQGEREKALEIYKSLAEGAGISFVQGVAKERIAWLEKDSPQKSP